MSKFANSKEGDSVTYHLGDKVKKRTVTKITAERIFITGCKRGFNKITGKDSSFNFDRSGKRSVYIEPA